MFAKSYALESVCKNLRLFGFEVEVVYKNLVSISIKVKFCKKKLEQKETLIPYQMTQEQKILWIVLRFPTITWEFGYIPTFVDVKSKYDMG